jgi:hypothetical protein
MKIWETDHLTVFSYLKLCINPEFDPLEKKMIIGSNSEGLL